VDGLNSGELGISAGNAHTCAVLSSGAIKCWGFNGRGQLGNGTTTNSLLPVSVLITPGGAELSGGLAVAAGAYHTCAYTSFWAIKCWGWNGNGQLGDGTKINRSTPINVDGLSSNANAVDAGEYHSCAVTSTGGAKCWGSNSMGKLGDGTTTDHLTPVNVSGLTSGVSSLSIGRSHTCVRTSSGAAKCWGSNLAGILGSGAPYSTMHYSTTPVDVSGLSSGVSSVAGGNSNTCAVISGGVAKCWGHNYEGETGDGTTVSPRLTPVGVIGFSPPVAPTPQYPNTTVYSTCPLFRWTQLSTATGYNLYVYTSANTKIYSSPVTPTCDGTACRFNPGITIPVGDYKWATRASNDFGASPTSTWLNFSVALPLPPTPSTPNGAIIVANPTFTWSKSGGATGYKLYVYTAANVKVFAGSVAASCGSSTCTYASSLGLAHGSYKWALKAGNANGYGATSNWLNFTY